VNEKVLGVLAGKDMPPDLLRRWASSADVLIAADAGADRLIAAGSVPNLILGDMDSISEKARNCGAEVLHIADQDSTDCDKLLRTAHDNGFKSVTLASIEGDSLDHLIGTVYSAVRASVQVRFALRTGIGYVVHKGSHSVSAEPGRRVSFLPILPCSGVCLEGVRWPLKDAQMSPNGLVSVSNQAVSDSVRIALDAGSGLLVVEYPAEEMPIWS